MYFCNEKIICTGRDIQDGTSPHWDFQDGTSFHFPPQFLNIVKAPLINFLYIWDFQVGILY